MKKTRERMKTTPSAIFILKQSSFSVTTHETLTQAMSLTGAHLFIYKYKYRFSKIDDQFILYYSATRYPFFCIKICSKWCFLKRIEVCNFSRPINRSFLALGFDLSAYRFDFPFFISHFPSLLLL